MNTQAWSSLATAEGRWARSAVAVLASLLLAVATLIGLGAGAAAATESSTQAADLGVVTASWGQNSVGQLGDGSTADSSVPVSVDTSGVLAGKTVSQVSASSGHVCALADGQVFCWGNNANGQLGDGSTTQSLVPVAVDTSGVLAGLTVTQVSAGNNHTCAIADGAAFCWGANYIGQLGDGSTTESLVPVAVDTAGVLAGLTVTQVSAGWEHACVVADGQVFCWGYNNVGQLGDGSTTQSLVPVAVDTSGVLAGLTVTQVSTGYDLSCVVADGQVFCWGYNAFGQLGDGSTTDSALPVAVDSSGVLAGLPVTQMAAGFLHACVVADGQVFCWGNNGNGQLGDGSTTESSVPVAVDASGVLAGLTVTQVAPGRFFTCAVADDQVFCWGNNNYGQLGDGSTAQSLVPVAVDTTGVLTDTTVSQVAAGGDSASVLGEVTPVGAVFVPVEPYRAYDSRDGGGPLGGGDSRTVGTGVPAGAVAVAYNVTVTGMEGSGYVTVSPGGQPGGGTSTVNYTAPGQLWANAFTSGVDDSGQIEVTATGAPTQVIIDVTGYFAPQTPTEAEPVPVQGAAVAAESVFMPVAPVRAYDSRDGAGALSGGQSRLVDITAEQTVPAEATAVAYTLTQTGTTGTGYLSVGPGGAEQPDVSTINWFTANQTTANSAAVGVSDGAVQVWAGGGSTQFIIDILGYYVPVDVAPGGGRFTAVDPARAYDSRVDDPAGPIAGGQVFTTSMGVSGVPENAVAVSYNLTITGGAATGYLTTTPASVSSPPVASTINWWQPNQTLANGTVVQVPSLLQLLGAAEQGELGALNGVGPLDVNTFAGGGSTQYLIDVAGYYTNSSR